MCQPTAKLPQVYLLKKQSIKVYNKYVVKQLCFSSASLTVHFHSSDHPHPPPSTKKPEPVLAKGSYSERQTRGWGEHHCIIYLDNKYRSLWIEPWNTEVHFLFSVVLHGTLTCDQHSLFKLYGSAGIHTKDFCCT